MKLNAETNDEKFEIELKENGSQLNAEINGRVYELEASAPEPNIYLFKHDNKIYQIFVSPNENPSAPSTVKIKNKSFDVKISDPKNLRGNAATSEHANGASEIKTAMPGKVVRILIAENQEVKSGDGVIIVEAMKMQNEMKSPKDGIVKEIRFSEGATVNAGDVLVVIE